MLIRRKTLPALLLAVLPCLALRCGTRCDDCVPCNGEYRGGLALRPGSRQWLPAPVPDSLRFINSNGFRAVLDRVAPTAAATDSVVLPAFLNAFAGYDERQSYRVEPCGPYFRAERLRYEYQGRNLALHLRFSLLKDLRDRTRPADAQLPLPKAVADTLADMVLVTFNRQYFTVFSVVAVPTRQPRPVPPGAAEYLDSVRLAGRTFFGVYRSPQLSYAPAPNVQPQYFYFRPGQGLVGFTYSNNEQWARF